MVFDPERLRRGLGSGSTAPVSDGRDARYKHNRAVVADTVSKPAWRQAFDADEQQFGSMEEYLASTAAPNRALNVPGWAKTPLTVFTQDQDQMQGLYEQAASAVSPPTPYGLVAAPGVADAIGSVAEWVRPLNAQDLGLAAAMAIPFPGLGGAADNVGRPVIKITKKVADEATDAVRPIINMVENAANSVSGSAEDFLDAVDAAVRKAELDKAAEQLRFGASDMYPAVRGSLDEARASLAAAKLTDEADTAARLWSPEMGVPLRSSPPPDESTAMFRTEKSFDMGLGAEDSVMQRLPLDNPPPPIGSRYYENEGGLISRFKNADTAEFGLMGDDAADQTGWMNPLRYMFAPREVAGLLYRGEALSPEQLRLVSSVPEVGLHPVANFQGTRHIGDRIAEVYNRGS